MPEVGKTSVLTWIKCPCKPHHVNECCKQLYNLPQGRNTAISQENQNDPPMPLNYCYFSGTGSEDLDLLPDGFTFLTTVNICCTWNNKS